MNDDSDLPKARGILLGMSSFILAGWYFGIKFESLSFFGNTLTLNSNIENLWLILAACCFYQLVRYSQRMPNTALRENNEMWTLYLKYLGKLCASYYRADLKRKAAEKIPDTTKKDPKKNIVFYPITGMSDWSYTGTDDSVNFGMKIEYVDENEIERTQVPENLSYPVPGYLKVIARLLCFCRGSIKYPWFTDLIFPILYGLSAVCVATISWINANY